MTTTDTRPPLAAVPDPFTPPTDITQYREDPSQASNIPDFEGKPVHMTAARITSVGMLEIDDRVLKMDDVIEMRIEARVLNVEFKTMPNGKTARVHVLKAIDGTLVKVWDEAGNEKP